MTTTKSLKFTLLVCICPSFADYKTTNPISSARLQIAIPSFLTNHSILKSLSKELNNIEKLVKQLSASNENI